VKQEVNGTVILPPLVFPAKVEGSSLAAADGSGREKMAKIFFVSSIKETVKLIVCNKN
jgi:hypothetical protein